MGPHTVADTAVGKKDEMIRDIRKWIPDLARPCTSRDYDGESDEEA